MAVDYDQAGSYTGQAGGVVDAERPAADIVIELAAAVVTAFPGEQVGSPRQRAWSAH